MSPGRFLQTYPAVLPQLASFHTPKRAGHWLASVQQTRNKEQVCTFVLSVP